MLFGEQTTDNWLITFKFDICIFIIIWSVIKYSLWEIDEYPVVKRRLIRYTSPKSHGVSFRWLFGGEQTKYYFVANEWIIWSATAWTNQASGSIMAHGTWYQPLFPIPYSPKFKFINNSGSEIRIIIIFWKWLRDSSSEWMTRKSQIKFNTFLCANKTY